MPVRITFLLALILFASPVAAADGDALATRVAQACGVDAWPAVERLSFTWTHHPSGSVRSYVWTPGAHTVEVTRDGETTTVDTRAVDGDLERAAHAAFVNDHYWMLFELRLAWDDGVAFDALGPRAVPGFADLGEREALRVRYTGDAGYTPGDAYVLYLDDDARPVAWAFHRDGAEQPSLVTTREDWAVRGGLRFPTHFRTADGADFITVSAVEVETAAP